MKKIALVLAIAMLATVFNSNIFFADIISPGDSVILTTEQDECVLTGLWGSSGVKGYNNMNTRFISSVGSCVWTPSFPQGIYKFYVYKTVHENSLTDQQYSIKHKSGTSVATVDYVNGTAGWILLGEFEFSGNGSDSIMTERTSVQVAQTPNILATRANAIKFELVEFTEDSQPEPGDVFDYTTDSLNYQETGTWLVSDTVLGLNGMRTRYLTGEGSCKWIPFIPQGIYHVYTYKTVHLNSLSDQIFDILSKSGRKTVAVDYTEGEAGWTLLGTYEFYGDGSDNIRITTPGYTGLLNYARSNAVRFELAELTSGDERPKNPGETMIIKGSSQSGVEKTGYWQMSGAALDYEGQQSHFLSDPGEIKITPNLLAGKYKIYTYKVVHANTIPNQEYIISSLKNKTRVNVDHSSGTPEWVELGTFDVDSGANDFIKIRRGQRGDTLPIRFAALKFELVEFGVTPRDNTMVLTTQNIAFYRETGIWMNSSLLGYNNTQSRYTNGNGFAQFVPYMPAGRYKVSTYKVVHTSCNIQTFTISHMGEIHAVDIDFRTGSSGWEPLGTYDFWGNGYDFIKATKKSAENTEPLRINAVKFELVEEFDDLAPKGKMIPGDMNGLFTLDIPEYEMENIHPVVRIDGEVFGAGELDAYDILLDAEVLLDKMGLYYSYDSQSSSLTITGEGKTVVVTMGSVSASLNGTPVILQTAPRLENQVKRIPAKHIGELFGYAASFDYGKKIVKIETNKKKPGSFFVAPRDFLSKGTWNTTYDLDSFNSICIQGRATGNKVYTPAKAKITIAEEGEYQIFVYAKDLIATYTGERYFDVALNGYTLPKTYGQHGINLYAWESTNKIYLKPGTLEISLLDSSTNYARCGGIFITNDMSITSLPKEYNNVLALADVSGREYDKGVFYPQWAKSDAQPASSVEIESDGVKMTFYNVLTQNGNVVQKKMQVDTGSGFQMTSSRENAMGALLMHATSGSVTNYECQFPMFTATYQKTGATITTNEIDIYKSGEPHWLIPSSVTKIDEKTVELFSDCAVASAVTKIELKDGELQPLVTFTLTAKTAGSFTANIISGTESMQGDYSYAFAPFRFNGARVPEENMMVTQNYLTIPLALKTTTNTQGDEVSIGIAVDPSSLSLDWTKRANDLFGMCLRGPKGGAMPVLSAPLYSSPQSAMDLGGTYSISYRMVEWPGDWYDSYEKLALDVYGLTDYRQNYYSNMNTAIFNTTKLAASDMAGWDDDLLGYYNIEFKNMVTQANPTVFLSTYLMTEDEAFFEKRGVPTLAYMLSRPLFHYTNKDFGVTLPTGMTPVGTINRNYGSAVLGGLNEMTRGLTEEFKIEGIDGGLKHRNTNVIPLLQEYVWFYKYTKDESYLLLAKQEAENFMTNVIYAPRNKLFDAAGFIAMEFYPQFQALIDLYEIDPDQRYLDAAVEGAKNLLPTVWIYPNDTNEDRTISADYIRQNHYGKGGRPAWYKELRYSPGYPDNLSTLQDETVPFWVVSRAGLSLEQTFTYTQHTSGNIIMANWAPDLLRLAEYSGEKIFETYARNAVVGRHVTYSGYYYNNYFSYQMNERYPYEGPDITGLYWHHIQPFLAMLQDFLITQSWTWSNRNIDFPSTRTAGYAYFSNRMYGVDSGKFFDQEDMWLWLKEGIIEMDNVQIDWVGAKKDGLSAFALMNQSAAFETVVITLGEDITGGASFNKVATVYDADGNKSSADVIEGKLTLTVPARGLVAFCVESENIMAPSFAKVLSDRMKTQKMGLQRALPQGTETDSGYIIQASPDCYYVYVTLSEELGQASNVTMHYQVGNGQWQTMEDNYAPHDFIVKVDSPKEGFTYYIEKTKSGDTTTSSTKKLIPKTMPDVTFDAQPVITSSGGTFMGISNHSGEQKRLVIAVAAYEGSRLINFALSGNIVVEANGRLESVVVDFDHPIEKSGASYKYFVWDGLEDMKPVWIK